MEFSQPIMKFLQALIVCTVLIGVPTGMSAQEPDGYAFQDSTTDGYVAPTDPAVKEKLTEWQDLKFGVLLHWGLYSIPGVVESWSICSEDVDWIKRRADLSYDAYKQWYFDLCKSFCPTRFDPSAWARLMGEGGMRYVVFTTKHHDGFCLFDTEQTDFSVRHTPLAARGDYDLARQVFDAFRQEHFMVGAYFSKPDWHCPYYWNPNYATPNRRENYRRERHSDWWQAYVDYTDAQLRELLTRYGRLDLLWLDGGWVSGDEIGLDSLLLEARSGLQRGMIAVDRTIRGRNENYLTPERGIPAQPLSVPWESCIPLSNDWGWVPNAPYKSAQQVVNTLIEVVAKGGNLLLGVGPTADGEIEEAAAQRLRDVGRWLHRYGQAIYATVPLPHFHDGNLWFTAAKDRRTAYALYALPEGEAIPAEIVWHDNLPKGPVRLLHNGRRLKTYVSGDEVRVVLPKDLPHESFVLTFTPATL